VEVDRVAEVDREAEGDRAAEAAVDREVAAECPADFPRAWAAHTSRQALGLPGESCMDWGPGVSTVRLVS
jgi:hypothetical protein